MNNKRFIGLALILVLAFMLVLLGATTDPTPTKIPDATFMDNDWAQDFMTVQEGQIIKQYALPEKAVYYNLDNWKENGFDALYVWIKYDQRTNDIIFALRNPDGSFLELFPVCPPYCPDAKEEI